MSSSLLGLEFVVSYMYSLVLPLLILTYRCKCPNPFPNPSFFFFHVDAIFKEISLILLWDQMFKWGLHEPLLLWNEAYIITITTMKETGRKLTQLNIIFLDFFSTVRNFKLISGKKLNCPQCLSGQWQQETLTWGCNQKDVCQKREGRPNCPGSEGWALHRSPSLVFWEPELPAVSIGKLFHASESIC